MSRADWEVEQTEDGLRLVLQKLQLCRAACDLVETGNGLLALSFLVKWVRSDTDSPPFVRSQELAMEALDIFRQTSDKVGLLTALIAASALTDPKSRESYLAEAEQLATELGGENQLAAVIAARARGLALSDRRAAAVLHHKALEIFQRTGSTIDQARCLFSLSIADGASAEKRDYALEAAQLFRDANDSATAAKCMMIAIMNAEEIEPLVNLEPLAKQALQDAVDSRFRSSPEHIYNKLALIAVAKGNRQDAEEYRRLSIEAQDAELLTPRERWDSDVYITNSIIKRAKVEGNKEIVKVFQDQLKQLKSEKPKAKWFSTSNQT